MKRVYLATLFSVVLALASVLAGCGSGNQVTGPVQAAGTTANLQFGDATNDQIIKFELTASSIILKGASGTADTANLLSAPAELEFVHTAGTLEPFSISHIPAGTYTSAILVVSNPEVVVLNGTTPTKVPATLSSGTVTVTFASPITVSSSPLFLNFDLDLAKSVTLNGNPVTSATVNPTFNVTTSTVAPDPNNEDDDNGEIEDVHGKVTAVVTTAPTSFTISTMSGNSIQFATDANTKFKDGITQLSDLKVGEIVEVDGVTKSDGTKLATKVELEGAMNGEEAEGLISTVVGTAPTLTLTVVHQVDSSNSTATTFNVTTDANTQYSVRTDKLNLGTVPAFDATHIGAGQRIEADSDGASNTTVAARKIKLREQALVGTVAASPAPTSTSFTLTLSPSSAFANLSKTTSIVVTIPNGANLKTTPTAGAPIRVRGLVFFNGTTYTMIATRGDNND
jgi:hypothetical protein